jgi:hypothetical protein
MQLEPDISAQSRTVTGEKPILGAQLLVSAPYCSTDAAKSSIHICL